ncbi:X-ray repair cross-complementing protein 5-like [Corticium candelabrum]|uniref:X-ray repair cross-complementing protein 5-like n=1 Tax=Corticium candelabrum TaxID=121492 RepID=UPI002E26EEA0|nr:X-ray repair cross-complementing protein 5-like [Corticium candelabrum]
MDTGFSTWSDYGGLDGDEDGEEEAQAFRVSGKDSLIFVIDCSESMFEPRTDGEDSAFSLCIRCAKNVLSNKIISSDKDLVGIVFFATDKCKNSSDFQHVYILQELDTPDARRILELEELLEGDVHATFKTKFGHSSLFSLYDVLWICSNMFANSAQKIGHKRVMLFTDNDNPHRDSVTLQRQARTKAKDLYENGIELELMHLSPVGGTFDVSAFYQDIIVIPDDEDVGCLPNTSDKFEELLSRVRAKDHKKRSLMNVPFHLGPGLEMNVRVFALVRSTKKGAVVKLDERVNQEVKTRTKYICEDTGTILMPTDIKSWYDFGGERVVFEKNEVGVMKHFADPGLLLMGFKPKTSLKRYFYVKPANFIYPDESSIIGSTKLFNALLQQTLARDVIAICRFVPRVSSAPSFVALVPQREVLDSNKVQISPAGFHVIYLPFAEDMRKLKYEETPRANLTQVDKAKEIVKKLTFTFKPDAFENPALQAHYKNLEALALDRDTPEALVDLTEPDTEMIEKRTGKILKEFIDLVYPADYDPVGKQPKKRAASSTASEPKRARVLAEVTVDVAAHAQNGTLSKLTVPVLKDFLKSVGMKCAGKKDELVTAVKAHFGIA